jgi:hypothetical protein
MLKAKVAQQADPFKSCILTGKRLVNALKDWDCMSEIQQHQLREDTLKISDTITHLLTKVHIKRNLDSLKRLHLAPENLKRQIAKVESGNHSSVEQTLLVLQDILHDIDSIKKEVSSVPDFNRAPPLPSRTPPRETKQSNNSKAQICSPQTTNLFSEIDRALDFTLPDFAIGSLLNKTSDSNTSASTISDIAPTKLTRAVIEKPRPKVVIKSVSTKPTFNPLETTEGTPSFAKSDAKIEGLNNHPPALERLQNVPRPLPSKPNELYVLISFGNRTLKRRVPVGISMNALELLFNREFHLQDFEILINDEKTGISYLLESTDDIYDGCLLVGRKKSDEPTPLEQISSLLSKRQEHVAVIEKKLDEISRKMQPSFAFSDEKVKEKCKMHMNELHSLRNTLEQFRYDVQLQLEETRSFFDTQLVAFRSLLPEEKEPSKLVAKSKDEIKGSMESCRKLGHDLNSYVELLETTRLDLTRGCRPATHLYQYLIDCRNELEQRLLGQKSDFNNLKAIKKVEWEATLQTILHEQKSVGESWDHLESIQSVMEEASLLFESIIPILLHQKKHKLPVKSIHLDVWDPTEVREFGKNYVLQELKALAFMERPEVNQIVENQRRMRVASPNPFQSELVEFTTQKKFTGKIGLELVEERRRQKDKMALIELWKITQK